ncbi:MAG: ABC transporter permease [Verrucomicrobiota bacterium]
MKLLATIRIALRALRRNALRSLLTMLGIVIGVGAVIAMLAIGNGAKARIEAQIASLGQNVILVLAGNVTRGGISQGFGSAGTLTKEDYRALRREIAGIAGVSPEVRAPGQIAAGNQNINSAVIGVSEDYLEIRSWPLTDGLNFTDADVRSAAKVALIGKTTAQNLFGEDDPVGKIIRIRNAPYRVIGLLSSKGMSMVGQDQDDIVLIPHTSAMVRLTGGTVFRAFNVKAQSPELVTDVQTQITGLLRQRHRITAAKDDDFLVRTQQEIASTATSTSKVLTVLLGSIAGVSLLVGGIGIMNIMLVSVIERTREIGVRLSVGARSRDILRQFLVEAITLSLVGGLIGILLGLGSAEVLSDKFGWNTLVSTNSVLLAFGFSAAIGVFFGYYPARKAAHLDPIEALRYE